MTKLEKQMIEAIINENIREIPLRSIESSLERMQHLILQLYKELNAKHNN
jgi:hypothetical protein